MSDTQQPSVEKKERRLEKQIEVAASPAEVWKALTDPAELARWFPLEARVTPGERGKIFLSWGPDCEGERSQCRIPLCISKLAAVIQRKHRSSMGNFSIGKCLRLDPL